MAIKNLNEINILYKYRYFDCNNFHIRTVLNNEFYFASKDELNDPFDLSSRPRYENGTVEQIRKHYYKEIESTYGIIDKEKNKRKKIIDDRLVVSPDELRKSLISTFEEQIKHYRICSFTANKWNDILMWAHYCNYNTGFCIGIDWERFSYYLWDNNRDLIKPFIVNYGKEYPLLNPFMDNESEESYRKVFSYKYDIWSYEDEVRLIMKSDYQKTFNVPEEFINEIILGLKISDENKKLIIEALKLKSTKPKLYQIVQSNNSFDFSREEIDYYK